VKQIVITSGKGGTGKTTVLSALARIVKSKVLVDADVDAANLEIVTNPKLLGSEPYSEGLNAFIDTDKCIKCDICRQNCRFNAIIINDQGNYEVTDYSCEGCKVCELVCPVEAVSLNEFVSGLIKHSHTPFGNLWHGELFAGRDNSGKMVTHLRQKGKDEALDKKADWILIDGAPGIGCQVIASITGVDAAIAVAEPTLSAIHDMRRIIELTSNFKVPVGIVINKVDVNPSLVLEIKDWARSMKLPILAEIPIDKRIVKFMIQRMSPIEIGDEFLTGLYETIWNNFLEIL